MNIYLGTAALGLKAGVQELMTAPTRLVNRMAGMVDKATGYKGDTPSHFGRAVAVAALGATALSVYVALRFLQTPRVVDVRMGCTSLLCDTAQGQQGVYGCPISRTTTYLNGTTEQTTFQIYRNASMFLSVAKDWVGEETQKQFSLSVIDPSRVSNCRLL